jgi:hypothetical protein
MKHILVKHYLGGYPLTVELTVDDNGYGILDSTAIRAFKRGQCHALALAIHELTGWTIKGLGCYRENDASDSPAHCVVWCPKLRSYVDIGGRVPRTYYRSEFGWKVINRSVTPSRAKNFRNYLKPNMRAARAFAKTVLRDLEIEFSTERLKKIT